MEYQPIELESKPCESPEDLGGAEVSPHHFRFRRTWWGAMACLMMGSVIIAGGWMRMRQGTDKSDLDNVIQASSTLSQTDIVRESNKVADKEWNWVLIKLNSATGVPSSRAKVAVKASAWSEQEGSFDGGLKTTLHEFRWLKKKATDQLEWDRIGLVAFVKGSASHIKIEMWTEEKFRSSNRLISRKIAIPGKNDTWDDELELHGVDNETQADGARLRLQMWFRDEPIVSEQEQESMNLTENIFHLTKGNTKHGADKASLAYKKGENNTKAIFYIPGRGDSFTHPHLLQLFQEQNFDLYTLDSRRCGRCRKYLDNPLLGHTSDDFDEYFEEISLALNFVKQQGYVKLVGYMHSTGAPVLLNYVDKFGDCDFDGFIMNGPFLAWGHDVPTHSGAIVKMFAGPAKTLAKAFTRAENPIIPGGGGKIDAWVTKLWLNYRFAADRRPLVGLSLTLEWFDAVNKVHNKLNRRKQALTKKPTFVISSRADDVLQHEETVELCKKVSKDAVVKMLRHNGHDVTLSKTTQYNELALDFIKRSLKSISELPPKSKSLPCSAIGGRLGSFVLAFSATILIAREHHAQ